MKICLTILLPFLFFASGCTPGSQQERGLSADQIRIKTILDKYDSSYNAAPNDIVKERLGKEYIPIINTLLSDSLKFIIKNSKVTLTNLQKASLNGVVAFLAEFKDSIDNRYWMEVDFPADGGDSLLLKNPAYKLLENMKENTDTVLSFFYMGEVKWDDIYSNRLSMRIVPFPKDYDFDSSRMANKSKIQ